MTHCREMSGKEKKVYVTITYDTEKAGDLGVGGVFYDYENAVKDLLDGVPWSRVYYNYKTEEPLVKLRNGDRVLAMNLSTNLPEIMSDELFKELKKKHGDDIMSESELAKVIDNYEYGLYGFTIQETRYK